jgi:hypothetical protein
MEQIRRSSLTLKAGVVAPAAHIVVYLPNTNEGFVASD